MADRLNSSGIDSPHAEHTAVTGLPSSPRLIINSGSFVMVRVYAESRTVPVLVQARVSAYP